jgi:hypothetical protein
VFDFHRAFATLETAVGDGCGRLGDSAASARLGGSAARRRLGERQLRPITAFVRSTWFLIVAA